MGRPQSIMRKLAPVLTLMAYVGYLSSIEPRFAHSYSASRTRASFSLSSRWRKESCSSTGCRRTCSLPRSRCRDRMSQCSCRYAAALPDRTGLRPQSPSCPGHARGVLRSRTCHLRWRAGAAWSTSDHGRRRSSMHPQRADRRTDNLPRSRCRSSIPHCRCLRSRTCHLR